MTFFWVWTRSESPMYDNNYSKIRSNVKGDNDFSRRWDDGHRRRRPLRLCASRIFFYVYVEEQFDGSLWSRPDPFLVREGPCGRSGWPRKDLIRVWRRRFSRILTSGIRNELSKGLKLNTCKGEPEQREGESEKNVEKEREKSKLRSMWPFEDFYVR